MALVLLRVWKHLVSKKMASLRDQTGRGDETLNMKEDEGQTENRAPTKITAFAMLLRGWAGFPVQHRAFCA